MRSLDRKRKLTPKTLPGIVKCVNSSKSSILSLFYLYFISILSLFYLYFISMARRWMAGRLAGPWLVGWLAGRLAGSVSGYVGYTRQPLRDKHAPEHSQFFHPPAKIKP